MRFSDIYYEATEGSLVGVCQKHSIERSTKRTLMRETHKDPTLPASGSADAVRFTDEYANEILTQWTLFSYIAGA